MSNNAPLWALELEAAQDWSMSPMQLEEETSEYWWTRWLAYRREKSAALESKRQSS